MLEMPIRHFLQEEFNPTINSRELDAFEAYTLLQEELRHLHLLYDTYAQATLTSGGHAKNPSLKWHEKLTRNVAYAQAMAENLYENGQLDPKQTIEAATIGLVSHWDEKDYITFWFNVLARPNTSAPGMMKTDQLRNIFSKHVDHDHIDFSKFNNYSLSNQDRYQHYIAYANAAVSAIEEFADYNVVSRLVAVSEIAGSLGASTERYYTKRLGGTAFNLAIAKLSGSRQPTLESASPFIVNDTSELVQYGSDVFDTRTGEKIVLVKDDELASNV